MFFKIPRNLSIIKYGITGIIFTIFSPIFFVYLSNYFSRVLVIFILEPACYIIKFAIYKLWVFKKGRVNIKNYFLHILPLYLIALFIAKTTSKIETVEYVALMIVLINGSIGYLWGNYLYSSISNLKNKNINKI